MRLETEGKDVRLFGQELLDRLRSSAFGSLSKAEVDLAIFSAMVKADLVDPDAPVFDLARTLECTTAKVNNLVFNHRIRLSEKDEAERLAKNVRLVEVTVDENSGTKDERLVLNVESTYWREYLIAKLKEFDAFTDSSFNRERVMVSLPVFVDHLEDVFGEHGKKWAERLDEAARAKTKKQQQQARLNWFRTVRDKGVGGAVKEVAGEATSAAISAAPTVFKIIESLG
ncbi:MAG: hypothetical protein ACTH2Q_11515 [Propionibacteriaceae bacterium]